VTIDGPAGSGKSTVARTLAGLLGMDFLDTGAMYRGVAAEALDNSVDPADIDAVRDLVENMHMRFSWADDPPRLKVNGRDVTHRLRDADVTRAVSDIAANRYVREVLVRSQRWIGREHPHLVTEGRDQGSVVFTDAAAKFYLDASPEVRARRRANQMAESGTEVDEQKILQQIIYRDQRDATRADGPMIVPQGAIRVDTSDMTLPQVIKTLEDHVRRISSASGDATQGGQG
jgi:cytidylate kinase